MGFNTPADFVRPKFDEELLQRGRATIEGASVKNRRTNACEEWARYCPRGHCLWRQDFYSAHEYDAALRHVLVLLEDAVVFFERESFGSAACLSITALEETSKAHVGSFRVDTSVVLVATQGFGTKKKSAWPQLPPDELKQKERAFRQAFLLAEESGNIIDGDLGLTRRTDWLPRAMATRGARFGV
jgi:hypothetical protein